MRVGSLFAGIGGFDLGFERAGFDVAWCVEWDKHAQAVLRRRFPNATVYGDIREVDPETLTPVDVICGGFPCQDLSVAGKRKGLAGERSGLFHDAMRIVRRLRPKLLVLENVPGLLSSNRGLDFATVLREVGEGWPCEEVGWRVLDSRYFGVAQRRRRVFVVAGSRARCAESVLALSEGVRWNPAPRDEAREDASADAGAGAAGGCGKWWDGGDIAASMTTRCHSQSMPDKANFAAIIERQSFTWTSHAQYGEGVGTLRANGGDLGGGSETLLATTYRKSRRAQSVDDAESWVEDGTANTLNVFDSGDVRTTHAIAFHPTQDPISSTDGSTHAMGCGSRQGYATVAVATPMAVRRLTPTECERLQGFPDGWTQIGTPEKPTADSNRYKQLGNAVTVNVAEWIARRAFTILQGDEACNRTPTG